MDVSESEKEEDVASDESSDDEQEYSEDSDADYEASEESTEGGSESKDAQEEQDKNEVSSSLRLHLTESESQQSPVIKQKPPKKKNPDQDSSSLLELRNNPGCGTQESKDLFEFSNSDSEWNREKDRQFDSDAIKNKSLIRSNNSPKIPPQKPERKVNKTKKTIIISSSEDDNDEAENNQENELPDIPVS